MKKLVTASTPRQPSDQYIRAKRKVEEISERYRGLVSRQFNLAELLRNTDQGDKIKLDM